MGGSSNNSTLIFGNKKRAIGFVKKAFSMGCEGTMLKALHRRLFTVSRSFEVPILLISMCMWDRCEQLSGLPKYN
jgi:hypothetical protein